MSNNNTSVAIKTAILPFLVVKSGSKALDFYIKGLGASIVERYETPDGKLTAKLSIEGADFCIGDEEPEFDNKSPETFGGSPVRIVLIVSEPDKFFNRALAAGAKQICPITVEESWTIGKLVDPFGHIWEIGKPSA